VEKEREESSWSQRGRGRETLAGKRRGRGKSEAYAVSQQVHEETPVE
jgi:hypothetical protein